MVLEVVGKRNGTLVVAVDDVLVADIVANFTEEPQEPDLFLEAMEERHIFRFGGGQSDGALRP